MSVDEIREAARFIFRKDPERLVGYRSEYFRKAAPRPAVAQEGGEGGPMEDEAPSAGSDSTAA